MTSVKRLSRLCHGVAYPVRQGLQRTGEQEMHAELWQGNLLKICRL